MMIEVMFELSIPFLMALIIDEGVTTGNMEKILIYGALMAIAAVCSLFLGRASSKYAGLASAGFAKNLRKALFEDDRCDQCSKCLSDGHSGLCACTAQFDFRYLHRFLYQC